MKIQTILLPVDFSTCAMIVTREAAGLAVQLGAKIVLVHIAELSKSTSGNVAIQHEGIEETAEAYLLSDTRRRLEPFMALIREVGVAVEPLVKIGAVIPGILEAAKEQHADLIMIGTHGRTGLSRVVLGSVAEGVAHQTHLPVMLLRREVRPECGRDSCAWCPHSGQSLAEARVAAEAEG